MPATKKLTERPIIFSGPSIPAILDGRKTQTRRGVPDVPEEADIITCSSLVEDDKGNWWCYFGCTDMPVDPGGYETIHEARCPYGRTGDRLWVKEPIYYSPEHDNYYYTADKHGLGTDAYIHLSGKTSNALRSIFMRRVDSRITLEVTEVRVERLRDISEDDCWAEAVNTVGFTTLTHGQLRNGFAVGWDTINAKRGFSWDSNPWVWVVEFRRVQDASD